MRGLTVSSLKAHSSLIPLLSCIVGGGALAFAYLGRLATRCPDVSWNKRTNPYPWQKLKHTDQYKFYSPTIDYKKLPPVPRI